MASGNVQHYTGNLILPDGVCSDLDDAAVSGMGLIQAFDANSAHMPGGSGIVIGSANGNYAAQMALWNGQTYPLFRKRSGEGDWWDWDQIVCASRINDDTRYKSVDGSSTSVATSNNGATGVALASFTIPAGIWWLGACVRFNASSTTVGIRRINLSQTSGEMSVSLFAANSENASSAELYTFVYFDYIGNITEQRTYYLNAGQNSGKALNATGYLRAYKLSV